MKPLIVRDKYQLDLRLGDGSYGEVYQGKSMLSHLWRRRIETGHHLETGKQVALKLEYNQVNPSQLKNEVEIYKNLRPAMVSLGYTGMALNASSG
jgi:serine/threonine protein kinase